MNPGIDVVCEAGNLLGESPIWDDARERLWWIDIHGRTLHKWSQATGHGARPLPQQVGCIGLADGGGLVCGARTGFYRLDPETTQMEVIVEPLSGKQHERFNDGRCDRRGRFWSGTVQEQRVPGIASLYRLDARGTCVHVQGDLTVVNGLAFSPDERTMYVADSHIRTVYSMPYDAHTGEVGPRTVFACFDEGTGLPDGATVDAEGCLWIAAIHGGRVLRYTPSGRLDRVIEVPVSQPTSCEFGGTDMGTLFITSARMRLSDEALAREPLAGSLFALRPGVSGLAEPRYGMGVSR